MAECEYACSGEGRRPDEERLFRFLFAQAAESEEEACEWLMVFDTDEYLTFQQPDALDVAAYIAEHENRTQGFPILRFPWVTMGADGHETRPPGLVVDGFKTGHFGKWMLKSAGRAVFLETWAFSHWCVYVCVLNLGV